MAELPDIPPSNGQDNTDGVPLRFFRPDATAQQKFWGTIVFGLMGLGIALYLAGRLTNGPTSLLALAGIALFVAPLICGWIVAKALARRDPVLAKRMAEVQARTAAREWKRSRGRLASLMGVPIALTGMLVIHQLGVQFTTRQSWAVVFGILIFSGSALSMHLQSRYARRRGGETRESE
jgi:hypothetical protein